MTVNPLIIIHGWSDSAKGMEPLSQRLALELSRPVKHIVLADYVSMNDSVTMDDLVMAMQRAWDDAQLSRRKQSHDVIVHSTAGLIVRDWLVRFYQNGKAPIKHLLMLAPANFGSPLAQKGRALIGRIVKGLQSPYLFQTGGHILKALELASPYSWQLALQDRFGKVNLYDKNKILCSVLIGNTGFSGLAAAANEPGTDGVVRLSTANLNACYATLDFTKDPKNPLLTTKLSKGRVAFKVMAHENHGSIVARDGGPNNPATIDAMLAALTVTDQGFYEYCKACQQHTDELMQLTNDNINTQGYQNTMVHVHNQFDKGVDDYFMEFYRRKSRCAFSGGFHADVIRSVHAYSDDNSYRSLFMNITELDALITELKNTFYMSITALPDIQDGLVGYQTTNKKKFGAVTIDGGLTKKLFQQNRTLMLDINLNREQVAKVFRFKNA